MISKIDLVTRVIQNEFQFYIGKEQLILEFLLKNHRYLFDRHYFLSPTYEGSRQYWQLYFCIVGVLNETRIF